MPAHVTLNINQSIKQQSFFKQEKTCNEIVSVDNNILYL
jgi:hypothetical protein